jgi:predicted small lipoprotein YifL
MSKRNARRPLLVAGLLALSLTACGKLGPLKQPAPMFGDTAKSDYQARQAAETAAKAAKQEKQRAPVNGNAAADQPDPPPSSDNAPKTKRDIQDPNQKLTPLSSTPVDGSPNLLGAPVSTRPPN